MNENDSDIKVSKKEEVGGGLFVASIIISLIILVCLVFAPASYYLGKWNDYWDDTTFSKIQTKNESADAEARWNRYVEAEKVCSKKAKIYFNSSYTHSMTSSSDKYITYECVGVKLTKIP